MPTKTCRNPVCTRPAFALGLCKGHYERHRRGQDPMVPRAIIQTKPRTQPPYCTVPNCPLPAIAKGLCNAHYIRSRRPRTARSLPDKAPVRKRTTSTETERKTY